MFFYILFTDNSKLTHSNSQQPSASNHATHSVSLSNHHHHSHAHAHTHAHSPKSAADRPYLGQTSLLPPSSISSSAGVGVGGGSTAGVIKSEPYEPYSCFQTQTSYPYQQFFGFPGAAAATPDVAYHHQHHVTAAAKLMASS